jgi:hypothetical protein
MTREELIAHLEHLAEYVKYSEDAPALREVIERLKCSEMPNSSDERTQKRTETHTCDLISRVDVEQTVEDNILCYTHSDRPIDQDPDTECHKAIRTALKMLRKDLRKLSHAQPVQPEITLESAIDYLHSIGWMQEHDRILTESAQPETCEGCKHLGKWENEVEYGCSSPCTSCKRRVSDNYKR